ncbi:MAG: flagellar hook-length control protein FliK [Lachnospiraceae bacterium]|nr:flagellar hook-length control protein FliK [Lachnospiraceae bacterium]
MINAVSLNEPNNQVNITGREGQVAQTESASESAAARQVQQGTVLEAPDSNAGINGGINTTIQRALSDAGLPVNERNAGIVRNMLENQMSIDRDSLHRVMTQANVYREADISTLLLMNKNNIPVNHFTAAQLQAYINNEQNLTLQIADAVDSLMQYLASEADSGSVMVNLGVLEMVTGTGVPEDAAVQQNNAAAQNLAENAVQNAAQNANADMTQGVVNMLANGQGGMEAVYAAGGTAIAEAANEAEILNMQQTNPVQNIIAELGTEAEGSGANWMNGFGSDEDGTSFNTTTEFSMQSDMASLTDNNQGSTLGSFLSENELKELNTMAGRLFEGANNIDANQTAAEVLKNIYENALGADNARLEELFRFPVYQKLIGKALGDKFTLKPSDITSADDLNEFYKETYSALNKLSEIAEKEGSLAEKLSKPMDNIKFMDTLNDVFPYIQLPLKLSEGNTRGELYVFKNGRKKTDPGDSQSVLLHLDMKNLGPTDIHMELKSGFLKLRFYCDNDDAKELLESSFGELEAALTAKNYHLTSEFSVRETETSNIVEALSGGGEKVPEFKYNFDIRA